MKRFVIHGKVEKNIVCIGILAIIFFMIISSCNSYTYVNYRYVVSSWKPDYHLFYNKNIQPVTVGFVCRESEPDDAELYKMIDEVIYQVFGEKGLRAIIKPGDKVVIKVNLAGGPFNGLPGQKGRGTITDPRIVRYIAEKVRDIIGWKEPASLIVAEALFNPDPNPSLRKEQLFHDKDYFNSFHMALLQRSSNDDVDPQDFCYDYNADGILDGRSGAVLVNLDSISMDKRFLTVVQEHSLGDTYVYMPNILRTKAQANGDKDYCDVLIGLPVLKSHLSTGLTGALKLHYGFRYRWPTGKETGRWEHSGYNEAGNLDLHADYICAQHKVRTYDFVLMDAITGNRRGPHSLMFTKSSDYPTDYLLMNSLLASTDSVALDTVASLLAGYRPETIPFTIDAAVNGIGICWPEWIRVSGLDSFTKHRQFLIKEYDPEKMQEKYKGQFLGVKDWDGQDTNTYQPKENIGVFGSYPFAEWGPARNLTPTDFMPYKTVSFKLDKQNSDVCRFSYSIADDTYKEKDVARIELLINGNPETFIVKAAKSGEWDVDLSQYRGKNIKCNLSAWDYNLNCTISEGITVSLP